MKLGEEQTTDEEELLRHHCTLWMEISADKHPRIIATPIDKPAK